MNKLKAIYLNELGIINALGSDKNQILNNLLTGNSPGMSEFTSPIIGNNYL